MLNAVLTIGGTGYNAAQRAANRIAINEVGLSLEGYDSLSFNEFGAAPTPTWPLWTTVSLSRGATTHIAGRVVDIQTGPDALGIAHGYTVQGTRWLVDKLVPVESSTGVGTIVLNRAPDDPYGVDSDRGLDVGTIVKRVLTVVNTATRLNALGVGGYTSLSPPTLPADTLADLANLNVVPNQSVSISGKGVLNQIAQLVARYHPKFVVTLDTSGHIRFLDVTDTSVFVPVTVTLPTMYGSGDPVMSLPRVRQSCDNIATRVVLRGAEEVEAAMLSLSDGTLAEGFTNTDKTNWTYYDFIQPKGATDVGTITSMTSSSVTVTSDDATVTWASNYWSGRNATLFLINTVASGLSLIEQRLVTSNTAMTAGGSATLSWDPAWPVTNTAYTDYRVIGQAGGRIDTWRLYYPRDPATGDTGLNTWIGAHLVRRSPKAVRWANQSKSLGEYYSQALVVGGSVPTEVPMQVEPVPSLGAFRFTQPTVSAHGNTSKLLSGSPTTVADGLPSDVQILALYSRGALSVTVPADVSGVPQYSGTGATAGIDVTEYIDYPAWTWKNDAASMTALANQQLQCRQDIVYDVSFDWTVGRAGTLPSWDWLGMRKSVNFALSGTTSPWSSINCPIRSIKVRWTGSERNGPINVISFTCSNLRKQFAGDDVYTHPQFAAGSPLDGISGLGGAFGSAIPLSAVQGPNVGFDSGAQAAQQMYAPMASYTAERQAAQDAGVASSGSAFAWAMQDVGVRDGRQTPGPRGPAVQSEDRFSREAAQEQRNANAADRERARDDRAEERRMQQFMDAGSGAGQEAVQAQYARDRAEDADRTRANMANFRREKERSDAANAADADGGEF